MFDRIADAMAGFTTRRPWLAIIAVVVVALTIGAAGRPQMSNESADFAPDAPAIAAAQRIESLFDTTSRVSPIQFVVIADSGDVATLAGLEATQRIADAIESVEVDGARLADRLVAQPGVGSMASFMLPVQEAIERGAPAPATDAQVKAMLRDGLERVPPAQAELLSTFFEGGLDNGAVSAPAGLLVAFFTSPADGAEAEMLGKLERALVANLDASQTSGVSVLPFSMPLIQQAGDDAAIEIPLLLFAAIGVIGLVLLLLYWPRSPMRRFQRVRRTTADTLLTVFVVLLAITTTDGAAVLLGPDGVGLISNVSGPSSIVPILLVGLGVDYAIHLNAAYRGGLAAGEAVQSAMARSVRIVGGALVLSAITTSFGFLTNVFAGTAALLTFGVLATVGIIAAFLYATLLFPAARVLLDRRAAGADKLPAAAFASSGTGLIDRLVGATSVLPRRAPWVAVGVASVALLAAAVTATNLRSGFSFLDFVPEGAAVRVAATQLSDRFGAGLGESTDVLVQGDVSQPAAWNQTLAATAQAGGFADVVDAAGAPLVQSPQEAVRQLIDPASPTYAEPVAAAVKAAGLSASLEAPADADLTPILEAASAAAPDQLAEVYTPAASLFRFTTQAGSDRALELAGDLEGAFGDDAIATSQQIIDATVVESISQSQVQSLVLALLGAGLLLMLNFFVSDRRPMLGVLTIAPVGGVVVLLYAFMVAAGIEFGPVTATLAAVVIGVGVDYAIHVTHRFGDYLRAGLDVDTAVNRTLDTTGSALFASAVTTFVGFAVLTQSSLIPFQQLGALTLAAIAGSALVSILVLPSMLVIYARRAESARRAEQPSAEAPDASVTMVGGARQSQT